MCLGRLHTSPSNLLGIFVGGFSRCDVTVTLPKYDIEVTQVWNAFGFIAFLQEQSEDQRLRSINALRRFPPD